MVSEFPNQAKPMTLVLVRHGEPLGQPDGFYGPEAELSPLGHRQAAATAKALMVKEHRAVYSSPYTRALQTAEAFRKQLGCQVALDRRLAEIDVSREVVKQIQQGLNWPAWQPHHRPSDDGETLSEFTLRVSQFCRDLAQRHDGERVVVFAHGGVINEALRWALGFSDTQPWHFYFELRYASITEVAFWPRGHSPDHAPWYSALLRVGDVTHLAGVS